MVIYKMVCFQETTPYKSYKYLLPRLGACPTYKDAKIKSATQRNEEILAATQKKT